MKMKAFFNKELITGFSAQVCVKPIVVNEWNNPNLGLSHLYTYYRRGPWTSPAWIVLSHVVFQKVHKGSLSLDLAELAYFCQGS
jgi:hypothetical protein